MSGRSSGEGGKEAKRLTWDYFSLTTLPLVFEGGRRTIFPQDVGRGLQLSRTERRDHT